MRPEDSSSDSGSAPAARVGSERSGLAPKSGNTSLELLARAQQGQASAVGRLFQRILPPLRLWARGRLPRWARARMDTEDLVQEAAVNAFRRLRAIEPRRRRALQAYLQESIKNRIRDEIRRAGRVEVNDSVGSEVPGGSSTPLDRALSVERRDRYRAALAKLTPEDQSLIVGRLELDLSYDQMALALNRPSPDAVRVAIRRALLRLAEEIGPE